MSWKEIHGAEQKPQGPQTFLARLQRYSAAFLYFTVKLGSVVRAKAHGDQENLKGKQTSHRPSQGDESGPHSLMSCLTRQVAQADIREVLSCRVHGGNSVDLASIVR